MAPKSTRHEDHIECRELAWKALCEGIYTFTGIADYVNKRTGCNHDHHWAKRNLRKQSKLVEELVDDGAISARAEYMQGLRVDLVALAAIANDPGASDKDKISARKGMTDIREKLAQARGVVTSRTAQQISGDKDNPLELHVGALDELRGRLAGIAAAAGAGAATIQPDG